MTSRRLIMTCFFILLAAILLVLTGCARTQPQQSGKIGVVVTIPPQADFVEKVAGDRVEITVMMTPGSNPHVFEPTPAQMAKVSSADVYVKVGTEVEFELAGMDKLLGQNPKMFVIDSSAGILLIDSDPHIWPSPANAKKMAQNIYEGLVKLDPASAGFYRQNMERYLQDMDDLERYIHERLDKARNRYFMIYHPGFAYFARDYNLVELAIEEEGKAPTPRDIQESIEMAKQRGLSYVFVAPQFPTAQAETIARAFGGQIALLDNLARDYIPSMRKVADTLALEIK